MICKMCDRNPDEQVQATNNDGSLAFDPSGRPIMLSGHGCHCVYKNRIRVAVGICCGHTLGAQVLAEEDENDRK